VDSVCTHTEINDQLVKEEKIKMKLADILFKVFNTDGTKNREVTRFAPLKMEINGYREQIDIVVTVVATTCWNGTCSLLTSAKL